MDGYIVCSCLILIFLDETTENRRRRRDLSLLLSLERL